MLRITDITNDFYSGVSGLRVGKTIDQTILNNPNQIITISMFGISSLTPSFINGAFLYLIDLYGEDYFKNYIKITQVSPNVSQEIKKSINQHFQYKKNFFHNFKANKIYCAIDGSNQGKSFRHNVYKDLKDNITFLFNPNDYGFSEDAKSNIRSADSFIGILTHQNHQDIIIEQTNYALLFNKPCLILCEKNVYLKVEESFKSKVHIMRYNRDSLALNIRNLNEYILNRAVKKVTTNSNDGDIGQAVLWTALGAGAVWLLSEIFKEKK